MPCLQEIFDDWTKEDPPTMKKLPVEGDVTELLAKMDPMVGATDNTKNKLVELTNFILLSA